MMAADSGAEAVEGAIKIARAATGRARILYTENGFHGLTMGALSVNGSSEFREGFGPLVPSCDMVPFGELDALEHELSQEMSPRSWSSRFRARASSSPLGYLEDAQRLCRAAGTLFVCDEVQTGIGRTGRLVALDTGA